MQQIVRRKLFELKPHAKNTAIFGDPRLVPEYAEIKKDIREKGLQEPLIIKVDGTILSGHLRYYVLMELAAERKQLSHEVEVDVRVIPPFKNEEAELEYVLDANLRRRQLSPRQISHAYAAMLASLTEEPPKKGGRPRSKNLALQRRQSTRERVARLLRVSVRTADNVAIIYQTIGVPADVLERVDSKEVPISLAADAVRFAIKEAFRRNPDLDSVEVNPIDVRTFVDTPPVTIRVTASDLIKGVKIPTPDPVLLDGQPVTKSHSLIATLPAPFQPKQSVQNMVREGVEWSAQDFSDQGLPLHESLNRIRFRLGEAFDNASLVREEMVDQALDSILERVAQFMRSTGKHVTIHIGKANAQKEVTEGLHNRLVALRACLEEEDPNAEVPALRAVLMDIAMKARDRANALQRMVKPKRASTKRKAPTTQATFSTDLEFILSVVGLDVVEALSA